MKMLFLCALALGWSATGAAAQSEWNPFKDRDEALASERRERERGGNLPPPLPPMDGWRSGRSAPSPAPGGAPRDTIADPSGRFGTPYPGTEAPPPFGMPPQPGLPGDGSGQSVRSGSIEINALPPLDPPPPYGPGGGGRALSPIDTGQMVPGAAASVASSVVTAPGSASGHGPALGTDIWRNADLPQLEQLLMSLSLPLRSPAMAGLLRRAMTASTTTSPPPSGENFPAHWRAVTLEALHRSGQLDAMAELLAEADPQSPPIIQLYRARHALALNQPADACRAAGAMLANRSGLPDVALGEAHLMSGYCAARDGNMAAAELAVSLARDRQVAAPVAFAALDALTGQSKQAMAPPERVTVLDYRLLELLGTVEPTQILGRAEPALLSGLARSGSEPELRVAAAELAAVTGAIDGNALAATYRQAGIPDDASVTLFRRARSFTAAAGADAAQARLAAAKQLLDETRHTPLYLPMSTALASSLEGAIHGPEVASHGETLIEVALAAGRLGMARTLANTIPQLRAWRALVDIAERDVPAADREQNLLHLEALIVGGRFSPLALHRLATVLDAFDVHVPIPIWEAASRSPQPASGYLPPTGVLPKLADKSKGDMIGLTILYAATALGVATRDAHIISLGDTIRGLRRVGFENEARRIGVEALLADWPRSGG